MSPSNEISDIEFNLVRDFLKNSCSISLAESKKYLVETRLERLLTEYKVGSYTQLIQQARLNGKTGLKERIIDEMTTNETLWFRDGAPFTILKEHILPSLIKAKSPGSRIRIWSSASSTGQEPYSIAIIIKEFCEANPGVSIDRFEILATDISSTALQAAKAGVYSQLEISRGMTDVRLHKHFNKSENGWDIKEELKRMVRFWQFNLQNSFSGHGILDIIFCRNVLIYFSMDFKKELMKKFAEALVPEGFFFLGVSESVMGITHQFGPSVHNGGVVYKKFKL